MAVGPPEGAQPKASGRRTFPPAAPGGTARGPLKLVIQIPCLNERDHLAATFADLPRRVGGFDAIEVVVIDDGSTDGTSDEARDLGVQHVVRFPTRRGLAAAFMAGIDASLRLGADVIVNTDADNQYRGADIARLVEPIVAGRADITIGDRRPGRSPHFSSPKRTLHRWGSRVMRGLSRTSVADATSGFRAFSRDAASELFVHGRFTYTLETLIQGGRLGLAFEDVVIETNPERRRSRLFRSLSHYVRLAAPTLLRAYSMYQPVRTFGYAAIVLLATGLLLVGRFALLYLRNPSYNGHAQSLIVGVGLLVLAFLVGLFALLSELIAGNRRLLGELLVRVRRLDAELASRERAQGLGIEGVESTGAPPWEANEQSWTARDQAASSSGTSSTSIGRQTHSRGC